MSLNSTLAQIRACALCTPSLPLGPRPIVQFSATSKILIAGQAPGSKVHKTGIPFDDPSGNRLRQWLGVSKDQFYDRAEFAILPMGFCFPGTGKSGDLPPRPECAPKWRKQALALMPELKLVLVIGRYARDWHLPAERTKSLTQTVQSYRQFWPDHLPMPHPSPRNQRWLKQNPWFEVEIIPKLQKRVQQLMAQ